MTKHAQPGTLINNDSVMIASVKSARQTLLAMGPGKPIGLVVSDNNEYRKRLGMFVWFSSTNVPPGAYYANPETGRIYLGINPEYLRVWLEHMPPKARLMRVPLPKEE